MISRTLTPYLRDAAKQFSVVAVMGPRQSGKTTLVKSSFPDYAYVSLEELDFRRAAQEDPRGFLANYHSAAGVIIDEIQEVPELFSYMQGIVDKEFRPGFFIIAGSQHFLLYEKITQTLAGRIALLTLLPFSGEELSHAKLLPPLNDFLIKGGYPRVYTQPVNVQSWCNNYLGTYVEKDVRNVLRITDLLTFQRFLKLCAARIGNLLNYADLARDADISPNTAKAWISILEASYIIKLLPPYHNNFNKRVIKSPKLYFYDSSLACSLLGIKTGEELAFNPFKGALFENCIISELFKYSYHHNVMPQLYFWRDTQGHEIDCIIEPTFGKTIPLEIKSGMTVNDDFFKGLLSWQDISQSNAAAYIVYGGDNDLVRKHGTVMSWKHIDQMLASIK